jgi:hypothetical protein
MNFTEQLKELPAITHLAELQLLDDNGNIVARIENKPGKIGSLTVYHALSLKHEGRITPAAAEEGLTLFAEHTADARKRPGAHPNIDRLFEIIKTGRAYTVELVTN